MNMRRHQQDWNELARLDPLWVICSEESQRDNLDELLESGRREVDDVIKYLEVSAADVQFSRALDFGCGVGRLTAAMTRYWTNVIGVDIADEMISRAKRHNADNPQCQFILNEQSDLSCFEENTFDFIYSNVTLQHIPQKDVIGAYLREFVRVLRPNGYMLFQLPTGVPILRRIKLRRYLYRALSLTGVSPNFLYHTLKLHPIKVVQASKEQVISWLSPGTRILDIRGEGRVDTQYLAQKL